MFNRNESPKASRPEYQIRKECFANYLRQQQRGELRTQVRRHQEAQQERQFEREIQESQKMVYIEDLPQDEFEQLSHDLEYAERLEFEKQMMQRQYQYQLELLNTDNQSKKEHLIEQFQEQIKNIQTDNLLKSAERKEYWDSVKKERQTKRKPFRW